MKRLLSIMLVLLLALNLCAFAMAEEVYTDEQGASFKVNYTSTNGGTRPEVTFEYTVTALEPEAGESGATYPADPPSIEPVVFGETEITTDTTQKTATIKLPTYTRVGVYEYKITQNTPGTPISGITYYGNPIHLKVTVIEDDERKIRVAAVRCGSEDDTGAKTDVINNSYESGSLEISKTVTGNMGDQSQYFDVKVTLTAPAGTAPSTDAKVTISDSSAEGQITEISYGTEAILKIKHNETITLGNIAAGTTYTVEEADYTGDGIGEGYDEATYIWSDEEDKTVSAGDEDTVQITNNKGIPVDTGISLDNAPYLLLLALALVGGVLLLLRRRNREKD